MKLDAPAAQSLFSVNAAQELHILWNVLYYIMLDKYIKLIH